MSVVVPFLGDAAGAGRLREHLDRLDLDTGDEAIIADNAPAAGSLMASAQVRVVHARAERSPFHARNVGAASARNEWVLFLDADCRPGAGLLDAYFAAVPDDRCGILAGAVVGQADQPGLIPAYARSRGMLSEEFHLQHRPGWPYPAGITGNMMVRRRAWEEVGGFPEGIVAGGDIELCWRIQDAGWTFRHVPGARVEHAHVASLRRLLRQASSHGAGMRWLDQRYPGSYPRPPLGRQVGRGLAGAVVWPLAGQPRRGLFKLIDAGWSAAYAYGYAVASNRAERRDATVQPASPAGSSSHRS